MKEPVVLDHVFQEVLEELENSNDNFFITGKAGTGKSTLLQLFRKTTHKKVVVLSPTGISALHVQGQTIHSFFQFPPKMLLSHEIFLVRRLVPILKAVEIIIIDEVSMVRADVMDAIDHSLRLHRKNHEPFGGVRMLFFGDLFQLPPVLAGLEEKSIFHMHYSSPYFFAANVFAGGAALKMIELSRVYRQDERAFIRLLDAIRTMQFDESDLESLNTRFLPEEQIEEPFLTLCSLNAVAHSINASRLQAIESPSHFFYADIKGEFYEKLYPTSSLLELKENAQVVFLRNDPERRFANGSLGTITEIDGDKILARVQKEDGDFVEIEVPRMTWENLRYNIVPGSNTGIQTKVVGSFTQYPVRLAWAMTIHKSQGKTYDRVAIDLGRGAFEHGQSYVALSRCRKLNGIYLKKPLMPGDILVDETVVEYYERNR